VVLGTYIALIRGKSAANTKYIDSTKIHAWPSWYYIVLPPLSLVASLGAIGYSVLVLSTTKVDKEHFAAFHVVVISCGLVVSLCTVCYALYQMYSAVYKPRPDSVLSAFILNWYDTAQAGGGGGAKVTRVTAQIVQDFMDAQKKQQAKKAQASMRRKQRRQTMLEVGVAVAV
jgi:hypothetical protein